MKLCEYTTAKALKELNYDGEYQYCHICTQHDGYNIMTLADCEKYARDIIRLCSAPRLEDIADWIREKYGLHIEVQYALTSCKKDAERKWGYRINNMRTHIYTYTDRFYDTHDFALEGGIWKAIELIKEQKK